MALLIAKGFLEQVGAVTRRFPLDYATTQNNLGLAYRDLANVRNREGNLKLAIRAFGEALKIYAEKDYPDRHKLVTENLNRAKKALQGSK